jgi:predicted porin
MKKTLIAIAALAAVAAQADVQIYGSVDGGIRSQSAADTFGTSAVYVAGGGIIQSNKLGFQGSEDLGGGLKSTWRLESNLNLNGTLGGNASMGTSNAGRIFDREAWVGVGDKNNEVRFGEQYKPTFEVYCEIDAISCLGASYFNTASAVDQGINVIGKRWSQTASYRYTSDDNKLSGLLAFSDNQGNNLSEGVTPGNSVNHAWGLNVKFVPRDDLKVVYAHMVEIISTGVTANGAVSSTYAGNVNVPGNSGNTLVAALGNNNAPTANKTTDTFGAAWNINSMYRVDAAYAKASIGTGTYGATTTTTADALDTTQIGLRITPSAQWEFALAYNNSKQNSANAQLNGAKAQTTVGFGKYFLSKTTYVYGEFDRMNFDNSATTMYTGAPLAPGATTPTANSVYGLPTANGSSTGANYAVSSINSISFGINKAF